MTKFELCKVSRLFQQISKQWVMHIVYLLEKGASSFTGLKKALPRMSSKTLSQRLKELKAEGFVLREVSDSTPVKISYSLTKKGKSLSKELKKLEKWAEEWVE